MTIFTEMLHVGGIKFKTITGFIKDDNYHPGTYYNSRIHLSNISSPNILIISGERFDKRKSPLESWVAVFVENDWRLVDPLLGAGKYKAANCCVLYCPFVTGEYSQATEEYTPAVTDHYFLTDPAE